MKRLAAALLVPTGAFLWACASNNPASTADAGKDAMGVNANDGGVEPVGCNAGCLCSPVDACPTGCYPSHTEQPDGAPEAPFCSNGIVQCVPGGLAWSVGAPANNCGNGLPTYLDSGPAPSGAFCCDYQNSVPADGGRDADAGAVACASPDDCINEGPVGSTVWCCLDKVCAYSGGAPLAPCTDADVQLVEASNYDQSCKSDSDCVAVGEGNACYPGALNCPTAAINVGAQARYNADVAMTNAAACRAGSSCGSFSGPCCRSGTSSMGAACTIPADAAAE
jgi:hypothetical protein